jgi:glycine cleavage system aminomethyltransferase T
MINPKLADVGDEIHIDIRGKRRLARIVKWPLYSAKTKN